MRENLVGICFATNVRKSQFRPALHQESISQINLSRLLITHQILGWAIHQKLPLVHDVSMINDAECFSYVVIGDQDSDVPLGKLSDDGLDIRNSDGVHSSKGFIQKYN